MRIKKIKQNIAMLSCFLCLNGIGLANEAIVVKPRSAVTMPVIQKEVLSDKKQEEHKLLLQAQYDLLLTKLTNIEAIADNITVIATHIATIFPEHSKEANVCHRDSLQLLELTHALLELYGEDFKNIALLSKFYADLQEIDLTMSAYYDQIVMVLNKCKCKNKPQSVELRLPIVASSPADLRSYPLPVDTAWTKFNYYNFQSNVVAGNLLQFFKFSIKPQSV